MKAIDSDFIKEVIYIYIKYIEVWEIVCRNCRVNYKLKEVCLLAENEESSSKLLELFKNIYSIDII